MYDIREAAISGARRGRNRGAHRPARQPLPSSITTSREFLDCVSRQRPQANDGILVAHIRNHPAMVERVGDAAVRAVVDSIRVMLLSAAPHGSIACLVDHCMVVAFARARGTAEKSPSVVHELAERFPSEVWINGIAVAPQIDVGYAGLDTTVDLERCWLEAHLELTSEDQE